MTDVDEQLPVPAPISGQLRTRSVLTDLFAVLIQGIPQLAKQDARANCDRVCAGIDINLLHPRQVDLQAALERRKRAGEAMPSARREEGNVVGVGELDLFVDQSYALGDEDVLTAA